MGITGPSARERQNQRRVYDIDRGVGIQTPLPSARSTQCEDLTHLRTVLEAPGLHVTLRSEDHM